LRCFFCAFVKALALACGVEYWCRSPENRLANRHGFKSIELFIFA